MVDIKTMLGRIFYSDVARDMTNSTIALYVFLLWRQDENGEVQVSYDEIQEYTGICNGMITKGIRELRAYKLITVKPPFKRPATYILQEVSL